MPLSVGKNRGASLNMNDVTPIKASAQAPTEMPMRDRSGIQVISRAAAILRVLKDDGKGLSLGQIAQRVGLPRSTVQRITSALLDEGFLAHDLGNSGLRLGPELAALGEAAKLDTVKRCRTILMDITRETGETTDLAVQRGSSMVFLDQVAGIHRLRTVSSVGDVFPLTTTANGRASLALMSDEEAWALAEREAQTQNQTQGQALVKDDFFTMLNQVRTSGLAYDLEEHTSGISAIGFAFEDAAGTRHAISVPVPASRFGAAQAAIEGALRTARKNVRDVLNTS